MLGECRQQVLTNGLRVLGVQNPALHSFVCSVYVRVGPRFESPAQTGLSHFLEHMILQGSQNFPTSHVILRSVEELGGVVDAATCSEYINVVLGVHRKHCSRALEVASDVLLRPLFDEAEIEQEKLIITQEISEHRDRDGRNISVSELAHCVVFRGEVCEAGTLGSRSIMERFDKATVVGHYCRHFTPANMVVCLAGGFDFEQALGRLEEDFGRIESSGPPPESPLPPHQFSRALAFYRTTEALPVAEALLCHRSYAAGDDRFDASRAVSHLLGGGLSSRLFSRVREELGLVYDIESHLQGYSDAGTIDVFLSVSVENLVSALGAALDVVKQVASEGFTAAELERYKEVARCGMEILCDQPSALADWFGKQELLLGPEGVVTPQQYVHRQEALALEAVNVIAKEVMAERPPALIVVGPYGASEREALRRLFPAEELSPVPGGFAGVMP